MIIRQIRDILAGRSLHAIGPGDTLRAACRVMGEHDIGALAVVDGGRLVGIVTERDIIRRAVCRGRRMDDTGVAEVMTPDPVTVGAAASLAEAMGAMMAGHFRHLPVMEDGRVVGMLSKRDVPTDYRLMFERFSEYTGAAVAAQ